MELKNLFRKFAIPIKKYKYVVIILLIGLLLMCIPEHKNNQINSDLPIVSNQDSSPSWEEALSNILSSIEGVGDVNVLVTLEKGEEIIYQTETNTSISDNNNSSQIDVVIVSDTDRNETGLIRQVNPAKYLGVIVVCQGGDKPSVRLAIVDAVSKLTGLGTDRISVLKMK